MKLTDEQIKELEWKISECLQDEMIDMHEEAEVGWWGDPDAVERVVGKVIESISTSSEGPWSEG